MLLAIFFHVASVLIMTPKYDWKEIAGAYARRSRSLVRGWLCRHGNEGCGVRTRLTSVMRG